MRKLLGTGFLIAVAVCAPAFGQSSSKQKPEDLAQTVSQAYKAKTLADLDAKHLAYYSSRNGRLYLTKIHLLDGD